MRTLQFALIKQSLTETQEPRTSVESRSSCFRRDAARCVCACEYRRHTLHTCVVRFSIADIRSRNSLSTRGEKAAMGIAALAI